MNCGLRMGQGGKRLLEVLFFQVVLGSVRVIDGDTIHDNARQHDYRIAGIDAPEIGGKAACELERGLGEEARAFVAVTLAGADRVVAWPARDVRGPKVWPVTLGRRLARIEVDGEDLAGLIVAAGKAIPAGAVSDFDWCGQGDAPETVR